MVVLTSEIKLILITHCAFYRRNPWLMALFILGFSLGSALLSAMTGLNQEAKTRYQHSSALIKNPVTHLIKPLTGKQFLSGDIWLKLKQNGVVNAQPVLRGRLQTSTGKTVAIQGVDTLLWLKNHQGKHTKTQPFSFSTTFSLTSLLIDEEFAQRIQVTEHKAPLFVLPSGQQQPDIHFTNDIGLWAITDLAHADYLLTAHGQLSFIELSQLTQQQMINIPELIKGQAQLIDAQQQEFDVLSQAFFFNLTALGLLGYLVAAFLSFNAIKLTLTARKTLLRQIHLLGLSNMSIQISLSIELVIISLIAALFGSAGGYLIANTLVLDVNRTLVNLYQLDKALVINWQLESVLYAFALNVLALAAILLSQFKAIVTKGKQIFYSLLIITVFALSWLWHYASNEYQALLLCFTLLILFILLVPKALSAVVSLPLPMKRPLSQWLHGDTRQHLKELHIAIVAILVALGSAIGMQIMVTSFSYSLNAHLEKQLSADIYLRANTLDNELRHTLSAQNEVSQLSIYMQSQGKVNNQPALLASFGDNVHHYQHILLTSAEKINQQTFVNNGCLANEQSQIKHGITLGSVIEFEQNLVDFSCRISGFFYDYGNPSISLLTLENRHKLAQLNHQHFGYAIRLQDHSSVATFTERLVNEFQQDSTKILPNKRFKQYANALFNDTFMVTKALNGFILAIALTSLFTSLLSLSHNQLKQLVTLANLGVTQGQLLMMKLIQTAGIVFFTTLFAIPLGFALGFALLKFVMPIAFGWTIHFFVDLSALFITCIALVFISISCAYLPIKRLTSHQISEL